MPANIVDHFAEAKGVCTVKWKAAMGGPRQVTKCLRVESLEPSEDGEERSNHPQAVARHPTEHIVHPEPADVGDAEEEMEPQEVQDDEEMAMPHMAENIMEGTEAISTQECVVREAWHGWWESLRAAHWM